MARSLDRILDELLVLKCQDGDVQALELLVSRWNERLRRHAWYLTRDQEAAADVVQDSWLEIVRTIRRLREPASFRGWAFRIVGNKAADWIRRQQRQRALRERVARQSGDSSQCAAADAVEKEEDEPGGQSLIMRAIKTLPADSQQILFMKYIDQMSTREIAAALAIPLGTVKSRLHHAREKLRQVLQRSEP